MVWASFLLGAAIWFSPESVGAADFVGAERCKLCHRQVYESWAATAHARAETLPRDADPACQACHATSVEAGLSGVQCESCHGGGARYSPPEVMIDREKALLAGLVLPRESVCRRCHAAGAPGHLPDFAMPDGSGLVSGVHEPTPP